MQCQTEERPVPTSHGIIVPSLTTFPKCGAFINYSILRMLKIKGAYFPLQSKIIQHTAQCSYRHSHALLVKILRMSYNAPTMKFSRF